MDHDVITDSSAQYKQLQHTSSGLISGPNLEAHGQWYLCSLELGDFPAICPFICPCRGYCGLPALGAGWLVTLRAGWLDLGPGWLAIGPSWLVLWVSVS